MDSVTLLTFQSSALLTCYYQPSCFLAAEDIISGAHGGSHTNSTFTASTSSSSCVSTSLACSAKKACIGQPGVVMVITTKALRPTTSALYTSPRSTILIPSSGSTTLRRTSRTPASSICFLRFGAGRLLKKAFQQPIPPLYSLPRRGR